MLPTLTTLLIIVAVHGLPHETINESTGRSLIIGGHTVDIKTRPYIVSLLISLNINDTLYDGICGGSILSSTKVLTAAHCLAMESIISIQVRAGSNYAHEGGQTSTTKKYLLHPKFNKNDENNLDFDIAIVDLEHNPLSPNGINIKVATLASTSIPDGTSVIVAGWGSTDPKLHGKGPGPSNILLEVQIETISIVKCSEMYECTPNKITTNMVCAGVPEGGKDGCQGDSGGPLFTKDNVVVGIVSFGIGCGNPKFPGVYTSVAKMREWIKQNAGV